MPAHRGEPRSCLRDLTGIQFSESLPVWTLSELVRKPVPIWPGMTTETLMCGAFSRRSVISASVNPRTANLAAE
jgi:hypothetical protein